MNPQLRRRVPMIQALTAILWTTTLTGALAQNATAKLRVNRPERTQQLVAQGARVIADYDTFQMLEAPAALAAQMAGQADVANADEMNVIALNAARLDTTQPAVKAMRRARTPFTGKQLHLVQFAGPIKPEWRAELEQRGARIVSHIPHNACLIYGDQATLAGIQTWAGTAAQVQWEGELNDEHKIHPHAKATDDQGNPRDIGTDTFAIQLVEDDNANAATLAALNRVALAPASSDYKLLGYRTVIVRLPANQVARLAAQPDVVSIQAYGPRKKLCERQAQIMAGNLSGSAPSGAGYLAWLASKGFNQAQFTASGFAVDVSDSGVDNGSTAPNHFGLYVNGTNAQASRVVYARLEGTPNSGSSIQGCDGHGCLNGHIIGGYSDLSGFPFADTSGYRYGLGICPFVKIGSSVIFDPDTFTSPNYPNLISRAYRDGARVSNNSWGSSGAASRGTYDTDAQTYDALVRDAQPSGAAVSTAGNQEMVIVFAAGNDGSNAGTVQPPGSGKNIISVGAGENVQAFGGSDASGVSDSGANSANDIISFSSRGPCDDGRFKPDLVAPGTHVSGGVAQAANPATNGTAIACYSGEGVSGGVSSIFFPSSGQQFYTASSGTSHSTPGVAGACALLRQYFINQSLPPPSPAMTKAYLINSARYMTGVSANDTLPSNNQGMGGVNLGTALDGVARILSDQVSSNKFTASGQARTNSGFVADLTMPLRVTLAWTDAPGSTLGDAYNNNLDLTVIVGTNTYKGNVFSGATSVSGGTADLRNNAESVFLPAGVSGLITVIVTAVDVNSDGVPNEAPATDQDYALVIYNATETATPAINGTGYSITNETCSTTNGAVDPGETVSLNFALQNVGGAGTTNLVATLLATGGVTAPSGPQAYGALADGGGSSTRSFTFTASGVCGSNITATLALTDGATSLGNVTFTIPLGAQVTIASENFDGVTVPTLPVGWSSTAGGGQSNWVTTTTQRDTLPNAAYSTDAASVGSNALTSAAVALPVGASKLTFRHRYDLESGYDGGVLEIKIGAGAFTDILAGGGNFVSGGYNATLSSSYNNPLGGRQAWSGTSNAFSTVVVDLPASAAGQAVQFRWRCGSDSSVSAAGWWIDSVAVSGPACCGGATPPLIINQPQSVEVPAGAAAIFSVAATGSGSLSYQWYFNSNLLAGSTATNLTIASAAPTNVGTYFVIITNLQGSATSSAAALTLATPPVITTNPASQTLFAGSTANFLVAATGTAPLTYQWRFGSTNIPGATTSSYSIAGITTNNAGDYSVLITNIAGAVTSAPATLTILPAPPTTNGVLVGWDVSGQSGFGSSPLAPTTNAGNLITVGLTRGAGVTTVGTAAARAWGGNSFDAPNAASAVISNDFATFSVTANTGYQVSFSSLSRFDYRRSGSGPTNGVLQYQIGSGAFVDIASLNYSSSSSSGSSLAAVDLSVFADLQNVGAGTNVTFRIVNHGATATNGTWYIYDTAVSTALDFTLQGSVTLVPPVGPPADAPTLSSVIYSNGVFEFLLSGTTGSNYVVQVSTNLAETNWNSILTNPAPFLFTETNNITDPQRFFRGRVAP